MSPRAAAAATLLLCCAALALPFASGRPRPRAWVAREDARPHPGAFLDGLVRALERLTAPSAACGTYYATDDATAPPAPPPQQRTENGAACREEARKLEKVRGVARLALHTAERLRSPALEPVRERQLVAALAELLHALSVTVDFEPAAPVAPAAPAAPAPAAPPTRDPPPAGDSKARRRRDLISDITKVSAIGSFVAQPVVNLVSAPLEAATAERAAGPIEDPYRDISALSKAKEGRNVQTDPAGAARTRLALEKINADPPLLETRRFGANYKALDVFVTGGVRILADV